MSERDLAEAIDREIIAAELVEYALEVWRDSLFLKTWSEADRMKSVLAHVSQAAIATVLARRQREAARTGPWEGPRVDLQYGRMQDALERIVSWSEAYPLDIFPEPDLKKARELLEAGGITLDAVSAHCMRHVIDGVGKIAREATRTEPCDGSLLAGTDPGDTPAGTGGAL